MFCFTASWPSRGSIVAADNRGQPILPKTFCRSEKRRVRSSSRTLLDLVEMLDHEIGGLLGGAPADALNPDTPARAFSPPDKKRARTDFLLPSS
jgi:hypothetical protein